MAKDRKVISLDGARLRRETIADLKRRIEELEEVSQWWMVRAETQTILIEIKDTLINRLENDIHLLHDVVNRQIGSHIQLKRQLDGKPYPPVSVLKWRSTWKTDSTEGNDNA